MVKDRYKLFLSWEEIDYKKEDMAILKNARFTGPVLSDVQKLRSNDSIRLDLSFQYVQSIGCWSIATLSWGNILSQTVEVVLLGDSIIKSPELTKSRLLSDLDYIVIDTEKHEEKTHQFFLVYAASMVSKDGEPFGER